MCLPIFFFYDSICFLLLVLFVVLKLWKYKFRLGYYNRPVISLLNLNFFFYYFLIFLSVNTKRIHISWHM